MRQEQEYSKTIISAGKKIRLVNLSLGHQSSMLENNGT